MDPEGLQWCGPKIGCAHTAGARYFKSLNQVRILSLLPPTLSFLAQQHVPFHSPLVAAVAVPVPR